MSDKASSGGAGLGPRTAAAFIAPALGLIGVFLIFPALWTLYLGFTNLGLTGIEAANPEFVGLENYLNALTDPEFIDSLFITLVFVFGSAIVGQAVLGFALAWVFHGWQSRIKPVVEVLVIVAWILPESVIAFLWIAFLDGESGTLNNVLSIFGGIDVEWLLDYPLLSVIVFNVWQGTAFSMLLFGAAINSVPPSHLETARLAGASVLQQLRDIVLPALRNHILTVLLLISLWTFNLFSPYLLTRGGPDQQTETLPIYIYRTAFSLGELGSGAAISAIMLAINLVIALVYIRTVGRQQ